MTSTGEGICYSSRTCTPTQKQQSSPRKFQKLTSDRLFSRYAAGERDFRGVDLSGQILSNVDLRGASLCRAKLHNTCLSKANLRGVNLSRADLCQVDLTGADLTGVNLANARLHRVNLTGANLRGADLSGTILSETRLAGADLGGAILPDGSILLTSKLESRLCFFEKPHRAYLGR